MYLLSLRQGILMKLEVFADSESVAHAAAAFVAEEARAEIKARGRFVMAVSGGHTPWLMLRALVHQDVPWEGLHLVQVDERVAPNEDSDRNLRHLVETLRGVESLGPDQIHAMPVEAPDLELAAKQYAGTLNQLAGSPAVLDLVHLGLGSDGHTASLVPGDRILNVTDVDVAMTDVYQNRRRMTLTYPIINRARRVLWLVTGKEKAEMVGRLRSGDTSIPAGRVHNDRALMIADRAAATQVKE